MVTIKDIREDFMSDVYNTLDFLPTNNEANRIIDSFDRVVDDVIVIPKGATNGDIIKAIFPNYHAQVSSCSASLYYDGTEKYAGSWIRFDSEWWNAPYKENSNETN